MFFPNSHSILLASLVDSAKCWLAAMLFCVHTFATLGLDFTLLSHNNFQLPRVRLPPLWYATVNHPHQGWGGPHERDKIPWKNHGFFERPLRTFSSWFWFLLVRFLKVQPGGGFRGFFWCNRQVFFLVSAFASAPSFLANYHTVNFLQNSGLSPLRLLWSCSLNRIALCRLFFFCFEDRWTDDFGFRAAHWLWLFM